jgi:hypothetical protein
MDLRLQLSIERQPDDSTCGPTCLQALYHYYNDTLPLKQLIQEVPKLQDGGTLAVYLACHALRRGYQATLYTYNLTLFDPTWFSPGAGNDISSLLKAQLQHKSDPKLATATHAYLEFLQLGGVLRFEDLTPSLIRRYLNRKIPVLTGLSSTYLYRSAREIGSHTDSVRGYAAGHFVVLSGYDALARTVYVSDPWLPNPMSHSQHYEVNIERLICAILLGVLTYDDNLLIIQPAQNKGGLGRANHTRGQ